jgi:hypothetical protein
MTERKGNDFRGIDRLSKALTINTKEFYRLGKLGHINNPSYLGGRGRRISVQGQPR